MQSFELSGHHKVSRREALKAGLLAGGLSLAEWLPASSRHAAGQTLPNGIRLPDSWPPRRRLTREPDSPPYLRTPPAVIPIDVGRQLFVDDFLIETTTLRRTFHRADYHPASPVLRPDRDWERKGKSPTAMTFSDGVWYDPAERLFKMWYMGGETLSTCYATSRDGVRWEKPVLDVRRGTTIVLPGRRDSVTVWLDLAEKDARRRFKLFTYDFAGGLGIYVTAQVNPTKRTGRIPGRNLAPFSRNEGIRPAGAVMIRKITGGLSFHGENRPCGVQWMIARWAAWSLTTSASTPATAAAESSTSMLQRHSHRPPGGSMGTRPCRRSKPLKFG